MSRNFALLQIVGKEQEYFQAEAEAAPPKLTAVSLAPAELKTIPADSVGRLPLRFEMEAWQLEELTKLVHGIFLEPHGESTSATPNQVVVLASSESGNGCTWICARAGELLASKVAGRVCLVDANFGRATLHEHFGVANHHGLAEALRENESIGGYVSQLSRRNLALLSAGSGSSASRSIGADDHDFPSERMRLRLQELRADFDYILIDGTSLDAGDLSITLAGLADGIVLVLKTHSTRKERTRSRVDDLKSAGVRILGAVLNQPAC